MNFVEKFGEETKPQIEKLLGIYTEKKLYRFTSREDIREFFKENGEWIEELKFEFVE